MTQEVALFWAVLAAFLFADNLVLVPQGGDFLRFGRAGRLHYEARVRFEMRGRDLVLLNPLNPFDRIALTQRCAGHLGVAPLRAARRQLRASLPGLNLLSWIGCAYLLLLGLLLCASLQWHFGSVLAALACAHLACWGLATGVLVAHRQGLHLSRYQTFVLAAEALFVPAYTVDLAKRSWYRQRLDLPALTCGLRQLRRMPEDAARELYAFRLSARLDRMMLELDLADATPERIARHALGPWLKEARRCLTTSAPPAGW